MQHIPVVNEVGTCVQKPNKRAVTAEQNVVNLYNNFVKFHSTHSPISQSFPQAMSHYVDRNIFATPYPNKTLTPLLHQCVRVLFTYFYIAISVDEVYTSPIVLHKGALTCRTAP
jgi:hypothetical protein